MEDKRYFVLEITTTADGTAKVVTEKSTEKEARMLFHQIMSSAYANEAITYALCEIIDERGFCVVMDKIPRIDEE